MLTQATQPQPLSAAPMPKPHPLWVRSVVCVWIVLFGWLSCAQAAHTHGSLLGGHGKAQVTKTADAAQLPGGEENCPLCAAMHVAVHTPAFPVVVVSFVTSFDLVLAAPIQAPQNQWHYDLFGRPPPAFLNS